MRYSPTVLDHVLNPRNAGMMQVPDGVGEGQYEGCGDLARFFLRAPAGVVVEARCQTWGPCGDGRAARGGARVPRAMSDEGRT